MLMSVPPLAFPQALDEFGLAIEDRDQLDSGTARSDQASLILVERIRSDKAPTRRWDRRSLVRTLRIVSSAGMPSTFSFSMRSARSTTLKSFPTCTPSPSPFG